MKYKKEIRVILNFSSGLVTVLKMPDFKSVKKALCSSEVERYGEWIRTDEVYDPEGGFMVTNMVLDENKKLMSLELTENWDGGFNER